MYTTPLLVYNITDQQGGWELKVKRVLLIDDEKDFCEYAKTLLQSINEQYEVAVANTAKKGLWYARFRRPDVIFLDLVMPDMDGLQALKKLKESAMTSSIPVVILTVKDESEFRMHPVTSQALDYIVKTGDVEYLKSKLQSVLSRLEQMEQK